jgi:hypothetical protein
VVIPVDEGRGSEVAEEEERTELDDDDDEDEEVLSFLKKKLSKSFPNIPRFPLEDCVDWSNITSGEALGSVAS